MKESVSASEISKEVGEKREEKKKNIQKRNCFLGI